ncbi:MAG: AMP-binding protein [Kofleriaceae bacterium]|nr:AMP-binding protein [Kofleriaceae bacterium]
MNLATALHRSATLNPGSPALIQGGETRRSYDQWSAEVATLAGGLRTLVREPGARVVLWLPNCPEYLTLLYASWHAGLCVVPANCKLHAREVEFIVRHVRARVLLVDAAHRRALAEAGIDLAPAHVVDVGSAAYEALRDGPRAPLAERAADDAAWIFFTSGTTGRPKGAVLTLRNLTAMSLAYFADYGAIGPDERLLHAAPLSHGSGLYALPFTMKGAAHVLTTASTFDPAEVIELTNRHGATTAFLAPTMLNRVVAAIERHPLDPSRLRKFLYGGAPMHLEDLKRALRALGPRIAQLYGQGETPMTISYLPAEAHGSGDALADDAVLTSVGYVRTGVEVSIRAPDGTSLPAGECGEIAVRGDTVMREYWEDPAATARALRDGWLYTGDLGTFDTAGRLHLHGRAKELIISGGSNIYPREVEDVLLAHPGVREVAVVGVPDPEWGEAVIAHVVASPDATAERLDSFCLERIARFKRPKRYVFHEELPKNGAGKLDKLELQRRHSGSVRTG